MSIHSLKAVKSAAATMSDGKLRGALTLQEGILKMYYDLLGKSLAEREELANTIKRNRRMIRSAEKAVWYLKTEVGNREAEK